MFWNDDEDPMDDFNSWYENLSEEEKAEMQRKSDLKWARMENHPLYKKAREITDIVDTIIDSLPEEERAYHDPVRESAMMLAPKFVGAYDSDLWILMMQNAAIMRYHAQYVMTGINGFNLFGEAKVDERYLDMLRAEIEVFQKLFCEWMDTVHALAPDREMDEDDWNVFRRA